ncbi:glutathione peroxidase [Lacimicrobium alkaliphilum]|uniref:Glutathione peroxidase n=1 Tax=Lacimicrobium alkaliphilum TaxID=1526571 RepID=A0A0U3AI86_9ALTE|nr:glutathione peroxidase [Lacimicrobium alkaliphilum]ALS98417.1 glutathione peroxidase [Lacimicrobium alkaliphilum]
MTESLYDFEVEKIDGNKQSMADFSNKVLLIVNTASKCGFTPQYEGLEQLYRDYRDKGLEILAFPCNQFGGQEPGSEEQIQQFCDLNYQTSFPLFKKVDVNGDQAEPLYNYLKDKARGVLGSKSIKWNFTKFLVDKQGNVVRRYGSTTKPDEIRQDIEALIAGESI